MYLALVPLDKETFETLVSVGSNVVLRPSGEAACTGSVCVKARFKEKTLTKMQPKPRSHFCGVS